MSFHWILGLSTALLIASCQSKVHQQQAIELRQWKERAEVQDGTILALKKKIELIELELEAKKTLRSIAPASKSKKRVPRLKAMVTQTLQPQLGQQTPTPDELTPEVLADSEGQIIQYFYQAKKLYSEAKYKKAVRLLRNFLREAPAHPYADHVSRWLIRSYLAEREYGLAVMEASRFEGRFPVSFLTKEVLIELAQGHEAMGALREAQLIRRRVEVEYPADS